MSRCLGMPSARNVVGWCFTEDLAVFDREPPKFPESQFRRDVGHSCDRGIGLLQRSPRQTHATKQEVLGGADPELLLARHAQGPAGNTDCVTGFRHMQGLERICFQHLAEPADDQPMMLHGGGVRTVARPFDALPYGVDQRLLEPSRGLGV